MCLFNVFLEGQSNVNFIPLNEDVGAYEPQEDGSLLIGNTPAKDLPMVGFDWVSSIIKVTAKAVMKRLDSWKMTHINTSRNIIANVVRFAGYLLLEDVNKAFAVKNAGHVVNVHSSPQVGTGMVVNSEKTRCPAQLSAEGQPRAKQSAHKPTGVCNEHVPPTEVKICSELHGDMQRLVETANPDLIYLTITGTSSQVTDCNTKYLHWRPHSRRNMVPLDPDRFSINQDARTIH